MIQTEFIKWIVSEVEKSIRNKRGSYYGYSSPLDYRNATESTLRPLIKNIIIPFQYPWNGMHQYARKVWEVNIPRLISFNIQQSKDYNLNYNSASSIKNNNSGAKTTTYLRNQSQQINTNEQPNVSKNSKEGVNVEYTSLINLFKEIIARFKSLTLSNPELKTINNSIISKLSTYLRSISEEKQYAINDMSWDKLVIGFFGETNAGKSTITESLRILLNEESRKLLRQRKGNCDGEIVGDGRQDFTQDYHEYQMNIKGNNFMLIDVPGIEGKENLFKGKIGEALRKAHVIFYVNGHNKNIDKGTAGKIKEYMGDGVKVVVIQNIRGNIGQYEYPEDRKTLFTQGTRTILEGVKRDFKLLVGEKFHTVIPVMGLLSMCAYGEFSSTQGSLIKQQRMLLEFFGEDYNNDIEITRNKIRLFSNIDELIDLIHVYSNNFRTEIANANFAKMEMFCRRALNEYIEEVEDKKAKFESYRKQVDRFIRENSEEIDTVSLQFERQVRNDVREQISSLSEKSHNYISGGQWESLENCFKNTKASIKSIINHHVNKYSQELTKRVTERSYRLKGIPGFQFIGSSMTFHLPLDDIKGIQAIKDADNISFGDVIKSITSTATGASTGVLIGSLFGPLGALIGGVIGGAGGLIGGNVSAGSEQTKRAQRKANEIITNYKKTNEEIINTVSKRFKEELNKELKNINHIARERIHEVDKFYEVTRSAEKSLKDKLQSIQTYGK